MVYNELMVKHGQNICKPIGPRCQECPIIQLCEYGL
jgi:endonuclease-3